MPYGQDAAPEEIAAVQETEPLSANTKKEGNFPVSSIIFSSKEAADYTEKGTESEHCSICLYWEGPTGPGTRSPGTCSVVSGLIVPLGWCRYFQHHHEDEVA